jgi:hypothetical protein
MRVALVVMVLAFIASACAGFQAGPPMAPGPPLECRGVPPAICQQAVRDAQANAEVGTQAVQIRAVCTATPCTDASGSMDVEVRYSDGRIDRYSSAWEGPGAPAAPPVDLPLAPTCVGLPVGECQEAAEEAYLAVGGPSVIVVSIVVTCEPGPCDAGGGSGSTTFTLRDGSTRSSAFSYGDG